MPEWILCQWLAAYDRQTVEQMLAAFLRERGTTIRCNTAQITPEALAEKLRAEGVTVTQHEKIPYALSISGYDYLEQLESFQAGDFSVQDISSMMVAETADPKAGDYIIDVCAAPGGKSLHLAEKLCGTGHVEARDLTLYKVGLIEENIVRMGLHNIEAVQMDATVFDPGSEGKADIVIADLPCSGLGVLAKKTDLKYKMTEQTQRELVQLQRQILQNVQRYVRPHGKLIYSTCTIHRGENEENARWFARQFPEFALVSERQMLPGIDESDGFYIAEFRKG